MTMSKRVAVIGAGASGLTAIKCCLEEDLEPVCYERSDHVGGLWCYTPNSIDGQGCVMKSTVINTNKEIMSYSDFPAPADYPVYMHNTKVNQYLKMYASHFCVEKYILFNHEVLSVKQADDFTNTGRWVLHVMDKKTKNSTTEVFDGVLICTGHHAEKRLPTFEGLDSFKGKVTHTHDYKDHIGYEDKRVVIIGIGNSGGDVAVELSRIAKQVFLSTRRGSWIMNRISDYGYPIDSYAIRRITTVLRRLMPRSLYNTIAEAKLNQRFNHAIYGLKPAHRFDSQHPMVNDEFPNRIASGTLKIKPDIKNIGLTSVTFTDGSTEEDIDTIILATGYVFGFPFVHHPALEVKDNVVNLYKYVFAPDIQPPTLAVIGCIQPIGAIMPISEIQCRWAVRVFKGLCSLPSPEDMWLDVRKKQHEMKERYVTSPRHTIQVDYIEFMDEIANQMGCKPDLGELFWKDPRLAWQCFFGPYLPYQYRLVGPHTWDGAREAIMTIWDRIHTGMSLKPKLTDSTPLLVYVLIILVLAVIIRWLIFVFL